MDGDFENFHWFTIKAYWCFQIKIKSPHTLLHSF